LKIIEVVISPSGETRVETKGFSGASCRAASELLERALGQKTDEQLTSEFHAAHSATTVSEQQGT
jgi:hypothetical protein